MMPKKTVVKKSEQDQSENVKSEEFKRFEQGLKAIFSLNPKEAKRIREEFPVNPTQEQQDATEEKVS